jgi:23S rRNA (adenine2503-C2)-methyltransferase
MKKDLRSFTQEELKDLLVSSKIQKYRAEQIFQFAHGKQVDNIENITAIPKELQKELSEKFCINGLKCITVSESQKDKTQKFLFETTDEDKKKVKIESVLIVEEERKTICISTQAGCNVGCEFCATGKMGLNRNLSAGEIVTQVYEIIKATSIIPTNIVYMGMGEPFLNYENVLKSLKIFTDKKGLGLSSKRITVSTVGFENRIKKFADDIKSDPMLSNVKLALSLHSTDNGFRELLIPTAKANNLKIIYDELVYFYRTTGNKITYEYIFFEGLNDTANDENRLIKLSRMVPSNINIIPFHYVDFPLIEPLSSLNEKIYDKIIDGKEKSLSNSVNLYNFIENLRSEKVTVNLRTSSGLDIDAACGQLAVKN